MYAFTKVMNEFSLNRETNDDVLIVPMESYVHSAIFRKKDRVIIQVLFTFII